MFERFNCSRHVHSRGDYENCCTLLTLLNCKMRHAHTNILRLAHSSTLLNQRDGFAPSRYLNSAAFVEEEAIHKCVEKLLKPSQHGTASPSAPTRGNEFLMTKVC